MPGHSNKVGKVDLVVFTGNKLDPISQMTHTESAQAASNLRQFTVWTLHILLSVTVSRFESEIPHAPRVAKRHPDASQSDQKSRLETSVHHGTLLLKYGDLEGFEG